ncbi:alkylmercury lyase [Streptomyces sp. ISL-43]|uniref:alkylmercury lyase family protein n=1 Tax=Streptomyces sp. ISL-43 TaxID=2819183 RepID=UPI001BE6C42E|nr:alkylmercury lyase family protein [Streptomyces sp. ISL-43]MBT2452294.1 alkylmercury lyase [Streptomyces sp. ISL-43]
MRITVLTVVDCPNARPAVERVQAALAGREAEVELVEVADEAEAARRGMNGSPTILIDGTDPFAPPGATPSMSCRLYRDADGPVSGVPSEAAMRQALAGTSTYAGSAASDCCAPQPLDVVGRAGRGRRAPEERGLRAVHQRVLRSFGATGNAPGQETLAAVAAEAGRSVGAVLAELAEEDFLTLDEQGRIRAAYPFSATPTRHRVRIAEGADVWSMCAIDALGIPAMLDQDVVISSTDPVTGETVEVTATAGILNWEPASTVVFVGQRAGGGPADTACCDALNFFTSDETARTWMKAHPEVPGRVVSQADAEQISRQTFEPLLAP